MLNLCGHKIRFGKNGEFCHGNELEKVNKKYKKNYQWFPLAGGRGGMGVGSQNKARVIFDRISLVSS